MRHIAGLNMTQTFIIIAAILSIYLCNCRPSESSSRTLYVTAKSGLILRERPEQNAPTIAILPYAVPVQVSSITEHESVIEGVRAKWIEISFHGKPAYAFSGFLSSTQPSVVVLLSYSPSKTRRFVLENSGPATLTECQNHYSATCVLKVFDGDKLIYERQGDAAVRWISDQTILLRRDLGDAGYVGSSISLLNVSTGNASPFCSFGSYTPIGSRVPSRIQYLWQERGL